MGRFHVEWAKGKRKGKGEGRRVGNGDLGGEEEEER